MAAERHGLSIRDAALIAGIGLTAFREKYGVQGDAGALCAPDVLSRIHRDFGAASRTVSPDPLKRMVANFKRHEIAVQVDDLGVVRVELAPCPMVVASSLNAAAVCSALEVAPSRLSVLIDGETGVGKEGVAHAIHAGSRRRGPVVFFNCAGLPAALADSQLFGHVRGAFTSADRHHRGLFEEAHGGTLVLDELPDLGIETQAKLLRVIEVCAVRRVGSEKDIPIDVRIIALANRDLRRDVAHGRFRADLYYRIAQHVVTVPPLRDRPEEILPLAIHFARLRDPRVRLHPRVVKSVTEHVWPGNVRQLKAAIDRGVVLASDTPLRPSSSNDPITLMPEHLPPEILVLSAGTRETRLAARYEGVAMDAVRGIGSTHRAPHAICSSQAERETYPPPDASDSDDPAPEEAPRSSARRSKLWDYKDLITKMLAKNSHAAIAQEVSRQMKAKDAKANDVSQSTVTRFIRSAGLARR